MSLNKIVASKFCFAFLGLGHNSLETRRSSGEIRRLRHATGKQDSPARSCRDLMTYSQNTNLTNGKNFVHAGLPYRFVVPRGSVLILCYH